MRFRDFDAAVVAANEPPSFQSGGVTYVLPPELPARTALLALAMDATTDSSEQGPLIEKMLASLLGADQATELLDSGVSLARLKDIIAWAISVYSGEGEESETSGNPPAPQTAGKSSSNTGH